MTRKSFIQRALNVWSIVVSLPAVYAIVQYINPPARAAGAPVQVPVGIPSEYGPGTVRMMRQGKVPFFVRGTENGQIRSFSAKCSHLGCVVEYLEEDAKFRCNCHGSVFDADGKNLTGPATRPLTPYRVEVRGDEVVVTVI